MAIDRVIPAGATLTIPDRNARERPGQPMPMPAPPPASAPASAHPSTQTPSAPPFANPHVVHDEPAHAPAGSAPSGFDVDLPGAVGALLEAMEGKASAVPAALARTLAAQAVLAEAASMQPNQLFMSRQMVWHAPDPSALAASWMAMIQTYGQQRAALAAQSRGRNVPASLFQSDGVPQVLRDGGMPRQLVSELDAWRFAVYAWGAEKLVLRVVTRDPDEEDGPAQRHRRIALRLEVHLPELGKVVLQMEPAEGGGVVLEIGAAQAGAMQHMRAQLPEIGNIASRCGVRILRVRLMRALTPPGLAQPERHQLAALTAPVFRAMAEVAVLLSQPQRSDDQFVAASGAGR